jgi:hypothetical protein
MHNRNPFYIQKNLDAIAGNVYNASHLRNGTLLVEVCNEKQAELLSHANLLGSDPIMSRDTNSSTPPRQLPPLILWMG